MATNIPQAHLDALAQQQGFPSYAAWSAWNARRQAAVTSPAPSGTAADAPNNWLQNLMESIPGHPAYLLRHVSDSMKAALGSK